MYIIKGMIIIVKNNLKSNSSKVNIVSAILSSILLLLVLYICLSILQGNTHKKGKSVPTSSYDWDFSVMEENVFPDKTYVTKDEKTGVMEYGSPSMLITIEPVVGNNPNLNMWISTIKLKSPLQIKSAFAGDVFSQRVKEKTSDMAARHGAVFAVNGAAYGFNKDSFVIRDGILYRDTNMDFAPLIIKDNGDFVIFNRGEKSGDEILEMGGRHTYDFGPDLIKNGEIVDYGDYWYKEGKDPRTAIGQKGPLEYVVIVADGRSKKSEGIAFYDLALEFQRLGCKWAYALDGGGSTTLYFNGEVLNDPSDWNGERSVSDILYFTD